MGAFESYVTAIVYAFLGASPLTLKVTAFVFSSLFIVITFLIGRRMAGWSGGLWCALLVALAPPFLPLFGNAPMLGYVEVLVIGSLVLLVTLDLLTNRPGGARQLRRFLVLGLLAGLGWWINPLILSYLATAAICLLLGVRLESKEVSAAALGFLCGSLPFWIFNLTHWSSFLHLFRRGAEGDVKAGAQKAFVLLLEIAGVRGYLADPIPLLSPAAGAVYLVVLGLLVGELIRRTRPDEYQTHVRVRGIQLLLLFSLLHLIAFSLNNYADFTTQRYLFPLYSSIPVLTGIALLRLAQWSRLLAAASLVFLLFNNAFALWKTVQGYEAGRRLDWWKPESVVEFLTAQGITRAYAPSWISARLTFESQERIVVTDPSLERYSPYLRWVNASPRVAYILLTTRGLTPESFESSLQGIGATYQRRDFGIFSVFYDFVPPFDGALVSVPPGGWRAETSPAGSDPRRAFDRDVDTTWLSAEFQKRGMWYRLDLGQVVSIGGLTVFPAQRRMGTPRGYRIELSRDGTTWDVVAEVPNFEVTLRWAAGQPRMDRPGQVLSRFSPRPVRYIRITQRGDNPEQWWAIAELFVYAPAHGQAGKGSESSAHLGEGLQLEEAGQWGSAVAAYERALRLDPQLEEAHSRIVEVYHRAGLPLEGTNLYRRGLVFEQLGAWAKAARQYETLLAQDPEHAEHSDLLNRLRAIYGRSGEPGHAERTERRLREDFTPPSPAEAGFGRSVRLLGYGLEPREPRPGDEIELAYYWQALRPMTVDYHVFVHFVRDGRIGFAQDHEPLHGRYPTSRWRVGELVRERYRVRLPPELPPGEYELGIGLWNPKTGRRLSADTSLPQSGSRVRLATLRVLPPR